MKERAEMNDNRAVGIPAKAENDGERITFGIAEDEPIENEALKQFIGRTFPDAEVIWQCKNGQKALENAEKQPPDVLIADIEMPLMNGLELCQRLYDEKYPGVILINTAFDKFEYTRRAIQLKVFDYILKPMEDAELEETLRKCMEEAKRRRDTAENAETSDFHPDRHRQTVNRGDSPSGQAGELSEFTFSMLIKDTKNEDRTREFFRLMGWETDRIGTFVLHMNSLPLDSSNLRTLEEFSEKLTGRGFQVLKDYPDSENFLMVFQPVKEIQPSEAYTKAWIIADILREKFPKRSIHVSRMCYSVQELIDECGKKNEANTERWNFPEMTWMVIRKKDALRYASLAERYLRERNRTKLMRLIYPDRECTREMAGRKTGDGIQDEAVKKDGQGERRPEADGRKSFAWEMLRIFLETVRSVWPQMETAGDELDMLSAGMEPETSMERTIEKCLNQPQNSGDDVMSAVLQWMEKDYAHDLTQAMVAERFGMDQAYFSRYFKKKTGKNFSAMMTDIRMRHAELLLQQNPQMTLEELCDACGLASKSYFSEAFKKWKGMTITQYLESIRK